MRATVQAIYSTGIPLGGGVAFFLGGWIGQTLSWRWAFILLGFPGLLVALFVFHLREAPRVTVITATAVPPRMDLSALFRSVPLRFHHAGDALFCLAANSLGIWGPSFFYRLHHMSLATIGLLAGILSLAGGVPGTVLGGWVSDRLRRRGRGGRMLFSAWGALFCVPLWLALLFGKSVPLLFAVNLLLMAAALMWLGAAAADVHEIVGPERRGLGIGVYFFTVNLVGYGIGPPIIGRLSDALGVARDPERMRLSLLVYPAACALAALLLFLGSRRMDREERDAVAG